jgi:hypothetical protein
MVSQKDGDPMHEQAKRLKWSAVIGSLACVLSLPMLAQGAGCVSPQIGEETSCSTLMTKKSSEK